MKEFLEGLAEIQIRMEKIEARLRAIELVTDPDALQEAEILLERYHQQVIKLENMVLSRKVALLQRKAEAVANTTTQTVSEAPHADTPVSA